MAIDITQVKTIFDLESIIERCFKEAEKAGYVKIGKFGEVIEPFKERFNKGEPATKAEGTLVDTEHPIIYNQLELIRHISMTIIGELHELEIVRRLVPIFRENRALSMEFLQYGDSYQLFYDKTVQDKQLHGLRIEPEPGQEEDKKDGN